MPPKPQGPKVNLAPRLPPLPKLRVRRPNQQDANPCIGIMSSVLGCWASSGQGAEGCLGLEESLRACMDEKRPESQKKNNINYHLGRMYPKFQGPRPKDKK